MSVESQNQKDAGMTLARAWGIYGLFLLGMIVLVFLTNLLTFMSSVLGSIAFIAYFICGFMLNRRVLRTLVSWHPVYNTLYNVSRAKLNYLAFWPILYPILFYRLAIVKHL